MIIIVAPYSPVDRCAVPHLGAARKIEAVIEILTRRDPFIVLVNTAHNSNVKSSLTITRTKIGDVEVVELTPPTSRSRRVGKFLNILDVPAVAEAMLKLGRPGLVWLYNGYAFESRFGRFIQNKIGCPVILELEDWHFSRGRGLNPKPFVDWLFWRALMPCISYVFAVNAPLAERMGGLSARVGLFPGVVADGVADISEQFPPFSRFDMDCVVGYFGGLSVEKGADQVAALIPRLPPNFKIVVTGSGELERVFQQLKEKYGKQLAFHGRVGDEKLLELIGSCDVLLNPHAPIDSMANGIFPFKVIEGIASGRLMISTPLPSSGLDSVLQGVHFVGHDFGQLLLAVVNARSTYEATMQGIQQGAVIALKLFGKDAILETVNRVCDGVAS